MAAAAVGGLAVGAVLGSAGSPVLAVGGLVGAAVVLASARDHEIGVFFLLLLVYSRAFDVGDADHGVQSMEVPFVALILGAAWVRRDRGRPPASIPPVVVVALALYGGLVVASALWAAEPDRTLAALPLVGKSLLLAAVLVATVRTTRALRLAVWGLLTAGLLLGAVSVFQQATGTFDLTYLGFAKAPSLNIVGDLDAPRVAGPIGDPNFFALMMVSVVALGLERFLHERGAWLRGIALAAAGLCALSVLFTLSRGGLLGLVTVVALLLLRYRPRPVTMVALAGVAVAGFMLLPADYGARLGKLGQALPGSGETTVADPAIEGRISEMTVAGRMFADHPVAGVGFANYRLHYQEYSRELGVDSRREERPAHSMVLEVAAELGVVGLAVVGGVLVVAFSSLAAARRRLADDPDGGAGLTDGVRMALIGFLVTSAFLHLAYPVLFWAFAGLAMATSGIVPRPPLASTAATAAGSGRAAPAVPADEPGRSEQQGPWRIVR